MSSRTVLWVEACQFRLTTSQTSPGFKVSAVQVFRKHCGKRRNFPAVVFYPSGELSALLLNLKLSSANYFSLEESTICRSGKG